MVSQKTVQNLQSDGFTGTQVAQYKISDFFQGSMTVNDAYFHIWITEGMEYKQTLLSLMLPFCRQFQ